MLTAQVLFGEAQGKAQQVLQRAFGRRRDCLLQRRRVGRGASVLSWLLRESTDGHHPYWIQSQQ